MKLEQQTIKLCRAQEILEQISTVDFILTTHDWKIKSVTFEYQDLMAMMEQQFDLQLNAAMTTSIEGFIYDVIHNIGEDPYSFDLVANEHFFKLIANNPHAVAKSIEKFKLENNIPGNALIRELAAYVSNPKAYYWLKYLDNDDNLHQKLIMPGISSFPIVPAFTLDENGFITEYNQKFDLALLPNFVSVDAVSEVSKLQSGQVVREWKRQDHTMQNRIILQILDLHKSSLNGVPRRKKNSHQSLTQGI